VEEFSGARDGMRGEGMDKRGGSVRFMVRCMVGVYCIERSFHAAETTSLDISGSVFTRIGVDGEEYPAGFHTAACHLCSSTGIVELCKVGM
jgi:hypothetical protein